MASIVVWAAKQRAAKTDHGSAATESKRLHPDDSPILRDQTQHDAVPTKLTVDPLANEGCPHSASGTRPSAGQGIRSEALEPSEATDVPPSSSVAGRTVPRTPPVHGSPDWRAETPTKSKKVSQHQHTRDTELLKSGAESDLSHDASCTDAVICSNLTKDATDSNPAVGAKVMLGSQALQEPLHDGAPPRMEATSTITHILEVVEELRAILMHERARKAHLVTEVESLGARVMQLQSALATITAERRETEGQRTQCMPQTGHRVNGVQQKVAYNTPTVTQVLAVSKDAGTQQDGRGLAVTPLAPSQTQKQSAPDRDICNELIDNGISCNTPALPSELDASHTENVVQEIRQLVNKVVRLEAQLVALSPVQNQVDGESQPVLTTQQELQCPDTYAAESHSRFEPAEERATVPRDPMELGQEMGAAAPP